MKLKISLGLMVLALGFVGCQPKPHPVVRSIRIPEHCVWADGFGTPCRVDPKGGLLCDNVHLSVSPEPRCNGVNPGVVEVER